MSWTCSQCGEEHEDARLSFHADFPDNYTARTPARRETDCVLGPNLCEISGEEFYLRGYIRIPVIEGAEPFLLGVWALVSEDVFRSFSFPHTNLATDVAYEGRLGNDLTEIGKGTWMVRCGIEFRPSGQLPVFTVNKSMHPLAILQHCGMTRAEANKLAESFLHRAAAN